MNRLIGVGRTAIVVVAIALLVPGCSADDPPGASSESTPVRVASLVGPEEFAARVADDSVVTVNVHVPDEGSIAGTDLTIPFDQIARTSALPEDRETPLAVYCRSGNMSADAVRDLEARGYTDIVELDGGFKAWVQAGRPLEAPPN